MSQIKVAVQAVVAIITLVSVAQADVPFVYLVTVDGQTAQTGFRVRGTKGVITALHGVVGGKKIWLYNRSGGTLSNNIVEIRKVDVPHDLAIVSNAEVDALSGEGFDVAGGIDWTEMAGKKLKLIGYPIGINLDDITTDVTVRREPIKPLNLLVDNAGREALGKRNSPAPNIGVLSLEGSLVPGNSGAPVLDTENRVVAVGDGGLMGGLAGFVWAIPLDKATWHQFDSSSEVIVGLRDMNAGDLFSMDRDPSRWQKEVEKLKAKMDAIDPDASLWDVQADPDRATYKLKVDPPDSRVIVQGSEAEITFQGAYRLIVVDPTNDPVKIGVWSLEQMYEPTFIDINPVASAVKTLQPIRLGRDRVPNVNVRQGWKELFYPDVETIGDRIRNTPGLRKPVTPKKRPLPSVLNHR